MSEHEFEVGTKIAFPGGRGTIVDIEESCQKKLVKILTISGETRIMPDDISSLRRV